MKGPSVILWFWLSSVAASFVWVCRKSQDKRRAILLAALIFNIFYTTLLNAVLGKLDSALGSKYDYVLANLDHGLGCSAAVVALRLDSALQPVLRTVYLSLIPVMILWLLLPRTNIERASLALTYAAELIAGPLLYCIVPACGPVYAFGRGWLTAQLPAPHLVRLSGMPNSFPSLHVGTAVALALYANNRILKVLSFFFLIATALSTISTGEHYLIDLVPGLAFGCFVTAAGLRRFVPTGLFGLLVMAWSVTVRFGYGFLLSHRLVLEALVGLTVILSLGYWGSRWEVLSTAEDPSQALAPVSSSSREIEWKARS